MRSRTAENATAFSLLVQIWAILPLMFDRRLVRHLACNRKAEISVAIF